MNTKAVALLVVAIVVVAVFAVLYFGTNVFADPWWETHWDENGENGNSDGGNILDGIWQDELVIEYADGTTDTLKLIQGRIEKPLEYYYEDKEVTSCYILLKAKVTEEGDSGFDGADLKCNKFGYERTAWNSAGVKVYTGPDVYTYKEYHVGMGNTQTIMSKSDTGCSFANMLQNKPDGEYSIEWEVKGSVDYRGYPGATEWTTAVNPPDRYIYVEKETNPLGQIVVTLSSAIGAE